MISNLYFGMDRVKKTRFFYRVLKNDFNIIKLKPVLYVLCQHFKLIIKVLIKLPDEKMKR